MNLPFRRRRVPLLIALPAGLLLATTVVRAQFRAQTTLVLVDVVVRDASGATVDDLDRADFTVFEDGVPRTIVAFDRGAASDQPGNAPDTQPYRWTDSRRAQPQAVTALVFHQLGQQARVAAVNAARQMIASLDASDFVGIYTLEESLIEVAPLTRDISVLTAALDVVARTSSAAPPPGVAQIAAPLDSPGRGGAEAGAMRGRMDAGLAQLDRHYAAGLQGATLSTLIGELSQFPGRRAVFLYSGGLATPDVLPTLEGVVGSALRQHVSFYCIKSGLGSIQPRRRFGRGELTSSSGEVLEHRVKILEMDPTLGLRPLADMTGGMYLANSTDITASTAKASADRRRYYLLGYTSGEGVDPERAVVTVRVGRPGLNVRARTRIGRQDAAR
jgi:VWFA-related protein